VEVFSLAIPDVRNLLAKTKSSNTNNWQSVRSRIQMRIRFYKNLTDRVLSS